MLSISALATIPVLIFVAIVYWAGFGFGYITGKFAEKKHKEAKE